MKFWLKNEILVKKWNFGEKMKFWWKNKISVKRMKFWWKNEILVEKWNFDEKMKYWSKNEIFVKQMKFWLKKWNFRQTNEILVKKWNFGQKFKFLVKNLGGKLNLLVKNWNLGEKLKLLVKIEIQGQISKSIHFKWYKEKSFSSVGNFLQNFGVQTLDPAKKRRLYVLIKISTGVSQSDDVWFHFFILFCFFLTKKQVVPFKCAIKSAPRKRTMKPVFVLS